MRVVLLLVLLVLMSITPPTLAVTTATATTTLPVEPDGGPGGQPGEPGGRPATTATATTTVVSSSSSSSSSSSGSECDPSYPDVCIPSPPPDLACSDISERRFEVVGSDPHALDGDNNGIACEGPPPSIPPKPLQAPQQEAQAQEQEQQEQNQTETRNLTTSTTTPFITNTTTKKTDGLLTASINGTSFTTNQTILVNGTVVGGQDAPAGNNGTLYVELRDPHNETMLYETGKITTTTTGGAKNESPFSYKLIAGDVHNTSGSTSQGRTVFKPMNETGANYTMVVGYALPQSATPSEVEFVFAYEHLLDDAAAAGGGEEPTTTSSSTTTPPPTTTSPEEESVIPPTPPPPAAPAPAEEEPEEEEDDDDEDDDDDNSDNGDDDDNGDEDDEDDNDDSRDALEILKDLLNREPPRDVDEDDD
jgi:hypothetical protein